MIESATHTSSEMNIMEAELEENKSICLENCCRLELMKRQMFQNENFQFSKCRLRKLQQVRKHYSHNLKASMKYYALTQYVSG